MTVYLVEVANREFHFDRGESIIDILNYMVERYGFNRNEIEDFDLCDIEEALESIGVYYKDYDDE